MIAHSVSLAYFRIHLEQACDVTSHVTTRKNTLGSLRIPILVCDKFLASPGMKTTPLLKINNGFIFPVVCTGYEPCLNMLEFAFFGAEMLQKFLTNEILHCENKIDKEFNNSTNKVD